MTLHELIIEAFPELVDTDTFLNGIIGLRNDSDGSGDYISSWNYEKPIPDELKSYLR